MGHRVFFTPSPCPARSVPTDVACWPLPPVLLEAQITAEVTLCCCAADHRLGSGGLPFRNLSLSRAEHTPQARVTQMDSQTKLGTKGKLTTVRVSETRAGLTRGQARTPAGPLLHPALTRCKNLSQRRSFGLATFELLENPQPSLHMSPQRKHTPGNPVFRRTLKYFQKHLKSNKSNAK